jgi:hypothetical protein
MTECPSSSILRSCSAPVFDFRFRHLAGRQSAHQRHGAADATIVVAQRADEFLANVGVEAQIV